MDMVECEGGHHGHDAGAGCSAFVRAVVVLAVFAVLARRGITATCNTLFPAFLFLVPIST